MKAHNMMLAAVVFVMLCLPTAAAAPYKLNSFGESSLPFNCTLCKMGVRLAKGLLDIHIPESAIVSAIIGICDTFHIEDKAVCKGAVSEFKDELITALKNTDLSPGEACVAMFGSICASSAYDPDVEWSVPLPSYPPRPMDLPPTPPTKTAPRLRVLHLTDIHWDMLYTPGSQAQCGEPLCCRAVNGVPDSPSDGAGHWGDYRNCDIPERTLDSMLTHIAKNEKFDMIYWTGDLPPHDIWEQTRSDQISILQRLTDKLLKYFPDKLVFSAVGNHESAPVDSFPPPYITGNRSEYWLYNTLAKTWSNWLPPTAFNDISYGGFYTVLVRPGFRLVSMNMNFCDHRNWWLLLNETDPAQELSWLVKVLSSAELNREKVHIIGHIPPGDTDCLRVWSQNYNRIVVRFSNTIAGQFFGHTHYDHYEIFYNPATSKPVSVGYIAPSVTTFSGLNPSYRVYTLDGFYNKSSWAVLDHETTILNITQANMYNKTVWQKEYSAKAAYGLKDMLPSSWHALAERMRTDTNTFNMFYSHYYKMNPPADGCDSTCRDALLCSLHMSTFGDQKYCDKNTTSSTKSMEKHLRSLKVC